MLIAAFRFVMWSLNNEIFFLKHTWVMYVAIKSYTFLTVALEYMYLA